VADVAVDVAVNSPDAYALSLATAVPQSRATAHACTAVAVSVGSGSVVGLVTQSSGRSEIEYDVHDIDGADRNEIEHTGLS
jgi:hypothetical protein